MSDFEQTDEHAHTSISDDVFREIVEDGEAGVGEMLAAYERLEERYFAAVSASTSPAPGVTYATHT